MAVLSGLHPENVWRHFKAICAIPHPSRHEKAVADHVVSICSSWGLASIRDEAGNILVRKPSSPGLENSPVCVLQSHLDMVPQKNGDSSHDFLTDPIHLCIDNGWVGARGTTLGADNGIGVACALAVLESRNIHHGPVEALFTVDEETGMGGALQLEPGFLKGSILVNLDTEDEHELCIGCAGGIDGLALLDLQRTTPPQDALAATILIRGLRGGHSGIDIHRGRANAIKLLGELLESAHSEVGMHLCDIHAGSARNAIPREALASVIVGLTDREELQRACAKALHSLRARYSEAEPDMDLRITFPETIETAPLEEQCRSKLLQCIRTCPDGVWRMSDEIPGLVETSSNLAIVKILNNQAQLHFLIRSSRDAARGELCGLIRSTVENAGARITFSGEYPGWTPRPSSGIVELMKRAHREVYQADPAVVAVHAGLECGIIGSKYPGMDMVSCGPTIRFPHSPDEAVEISSVGRFFDVLSRALELIGQSRG